MELEFHVKYSSSWKSSFLKKIQVELEFYELEQFTWNSSSKKKKKKKGFQKKKFLSSRSLYLDVSKIELYI